MSIGSYIRHSVFLPFSKRIISLSHSALFLSQLKRRDVIKPKKSFNCNADKKKNKKKHKITNEVVSAGYNLFNNAQQQTKTDAFQPETFFSVTLVARQTRPRARARPKCYILNCNANNFIFLFCDNCFTQHHSILSAPTTVFEIAACTNWAPAELRLKRLLTRDDVTDTESEKGGEITPNCASHRSEEDARIWTPN